MKKASMSNIMKKFLCAIIAVLMLAGTACNSGDEPIETHSCTKICDSCQKCLNAACKEEACAEKCGGHHACTSVCGVCQKCFNTACAEEVCADKCAGHAEEPFVFNDNDYITDSAISIDTGSAVLDIGENVYVREDIAEQTEIILTTIEATAGLDFDGMGFGQEIHTDGKIHITATRDKLYAVQDWYQGSIYSEYGLASASLTTHATISPAELLISHSEAMVHELAHVLMYRQTGWAHCQLLDEGFAVYTTYLTLKSFEENDPSFLTTLGVPSNCVNDMAMVTEGLYEHPIEYWFDHTIDASYSSNTNYVIGFRFMAYLDEVYGDYTKWVLKFNEMYPYPGNWEWNVSPVDQQLAVLKATYGDDVLDGFYPWLKNNEAKFKRNNSPFMSLEGVESINWYPTFNAVTSSVTLLPRFAYKDLYINIETVRKYLSEYKNCDISDLQLKIGERTAVVNLYRADGSYTTVRGGQKVSLEGISYIKLVGEGYLSQLEVVGFTLPS